MHYRNRVSIIVLKLNDTAEGSMAIQLISDSTIKDGIYREFEDALCDGELDAEFREFALNASSNKNMTDVVDDFLGELTEKQMKADKETNKNSDGYNAYQARKQAIINSVELK